MQDSVPNRAGTKQVPRSMRGGMQCSRRFQSGWRDWCGADITRPAMSRSPNVR